MMQLPGEQRPGVRARSDRSCRDRKANQLSSFMVAGNDGDNYGKLTLYQVPDQFGRALAARAPRR